VREASAFRGRAGVLSADDTHEKPQLRASVISPVLTWLPIGGSLTQGSWVWGFQASCSLHCGGWPGVLVDRLLEGSCCWQPTRGDSVLVVHSERDFCETVLPTSYRMRCIVNNRASTGNENEGGKDWDDQANKSNQACHANTFNRALIYLIVLSFSELPRNYLKPIE